MPTVNDALSALLLALGFDAMAEDVKTETDRERINRYGKIIVKNTPEAQRPAVRSRLLALRVL